MKIAEYNDMMAYLTRQNFNGGGSGKKSTLEDLKQSGQIKTATDYKPKKPKIIQLIRDFELRNPRKKNDEGGPQIVEPPKSMQVDTTTRGIGDPLEDFKEKADRLLQGSFASTNKDFFNNLIEQEYQKALDAGVRPQEALSFLQERSQMYRTLADEGRRQGEPAVLGPSYTRENFKFGTEPETIKKIKKFVDEGKNINEIAESFKVSRSTMKRAMSDAGIKIVDQAAMTEELTNVYNNLKTKLGRDPSYAEMIRESGRDKNTIKRNIGNLTFSEGRKVEGAGKKGLEASKEYFKTRKVDKPSYSKIDGKVSLKWPSPEVEQNYIKDLETIYSRPKGQNTNDMLAEKYKIPKAEVERINSVLIRDRNLQYPEADSTGRYKTRRGRLETTTGKKFVNVKGTPEMQFHHIKQIGGEVPLTAKDVAFISKEMNSKLSPYNKKLNNIADEISDTITASFKAMEAKNEGEALDLLKKVDVLNKEAESIVGEAAETLPKKYKPYIGFNKFFARTDEYGFPLDDKVRVEPIGGGVQRGEFEKPLTQYDEREAIDFKRKLEKDLRKKIKKTGKVGAAGILAAAVPSTFALADDKLAGEQPVEGTGEGLPSEAALPAGVLLGKYGPQILDATKNVGKIGLKTLGSLPAAGTFAGMTIKENLDQGKNIVDATVDPLVGIELLLPETVKKLGPLMARAARVSTPVGAALTGVGLLKERALGMMRDADAMTNTPYQQDLIDEYAAKQYRGFESGGRVGFADGPEDPSKRKFMKIVGGLASLPIVGRFFDVAEKAAPIVQKITTPSATGKPEWFDTLVNKVIQEGTDMTKQFATKEREIVHGTKISDDEYVRVVQDLDDDAVRIEYDSPTNVGQDTVVLQVKAGKMDEATGKKPRDEFYAAETEPRYVGGPEDADIEFDGENSGPGLMFIESDVSNLKQFATGKKLTKEEATKAEKRKDYVAKINDDSYEAAQHLSGKYGDGPDIDFPDDYDGN